MGVRRLAFPLRSADIGAGGWRWTFHSPTGSGPEGSSPNENGRVFVQPPTSFGVCRSGAGDSSDRPAGEAMDDEPHTPPAETDAGPGLFGDAPPPRAAPRAYR